jgi:hypothetical protein
MTAADGRSRAVGALCGPATWLEVLRGIVWRHSDLRLTAAEHPAAFPGLFDGLPTVPPEAGATASQGDCALPVQGYGASSAQAYGTLLAPGTAPWRHP